MDTLLAVVFRSQRLDNLTKTLRISFTFDKYFQYQGHNVPALLAPVIGAVVQCAQNLNILELSDAALFRLCLNPALSFTFLGDAERLFATCVAGLALVQRQMGAISAEIVRRLVLT